MCCLSCFQACAWALPRWPHDSRALKHGRQDCPTRLLTGHSHSEMLGSHPAEQGQNKDLQKKGKVCGVWSSRQVLGQSGAEALSSSSSPCGLGALQWHVLLRSWWHCAGMCRSAWDSLAWLKLPHIMCTSMPVSLYPETCAIATLKCYYGEFLWSITYISPSLIFFSRKELWAIKPIHF